MENAAKMIAAIYNNLGDYRHCLAWTDEIQEKRFAYAMRATNLRQLGFHARAETAALKAVEEDPSFLYGYWELGISLQLQGRLKEAETELRTGYALDAGNVPMLSVLGRVCAQQGTWNEGIALLKKAVALDPWYVWSHLVQ